MRAYHSQISSSSSPRGLGRVMQILKALAEEPAGMTLSRLSMRLGEPKTTLLGTLRALEADAYVMHKDGVYQIGTSAISLAGRIAAGSRFPASIRWLLAELVARTGETGIVGVLSEDESEVVYVDMILSHNAIRFTATIGSRRPLFSSAIGRAILAFQSDAFTDDYLARTPLTAFTPLTEIDPQRIRTRLAEIRREGFAASIGETTAGVGGAAAPIADGQGRISAAILVAAPAERVIDRLKELAERIHETAEEASCALGYIGSFPPQQR